jgi:hypothetical protein
MSEALTLQMLQEQLEGKDPFAMAHLKQKSLFQDAGEAQLVGAPFQPPQAQQMPQAQPEQGQAMKSLFESQAQQAPDKAFMESLKKMQIDPKGISPNQLGKFNLMSRLKAKYGNEFSKQPEVRDLLSAFDKHMEASVPSVDVMQKNQAKRTLAALGGGR